MYRCFYALISDNSFGDITAGVATQCLKSSKCFRAKPQYYANVLLKCVNLVPLCSSKLNWLWSAGSMSSSVA